MKTFSNTFPKITDAAFLRMIRIVLLIFALCVLFYALQSDSSIHKMVENAYKITLVAAFVPLTAGLFWKRTTTQGRWGAECLDFAGNTVTCASTRGLPHQMAGLLVAVLDMGVSSCLPQWYHAPVSALEAEFLAEEHPGPVASGD